MARFSSLKKILISGACLCTLVPMNALAEVHAEPPPMIALPKGATVTSIISDLVKKGDVRDPDYMAGLLGVKPKYRKQFMYSLVPGRTAIYFDTYGPDSNNIMETDKVVEIGVQHILKNIPCIKTSDFQPLFVNKPSESPGGITGSIEHVFRKDVDANFYLTLSLITEDNCAEVITLTMLKK